MSNKTFLTIVESYGGQYDFTHPLGTLTRANLIFQFGKYFNNSDLKSKLKDAPTLYHMVNVISTHTEELVTPRTPDQIEEFEIQIVKIITFAKIPKR